MYKIYAIVGELGSGKQKIVQSVVEAAPERFFAIPFYTTTTYFQGKLMSSTEMVPHLLNGDVLSVYSNSFGYRMSLFNELSEDRINIGVFSPATLFQLQDHSNVDITVFYVHNTTKTQLTNLSEWDGWTFGQLADLYLELTKDFTTNWEMDLDKEAVWLSMNGLDDLVNNTKMILALGKEELNG